MSGGAAGTAFGPIVLSAIEHNEPLGRRLVDDPLAESFLPKPLRAVVAATRQPLLRRAMITASERVGPGLWANIACRKRYIDDNLADGLDAFDAMVVLGAGFDTRACRLAQHSALPVFEVDLPVNITRKRALVVRALGAVPPSVRLVAVDFERDSFLTALERQGYRGGRTFVVWEGVTQYLSADAVGATFAQLRQISSGSNIDFTYVRREFVDGTESYGASTLYRKFVRGLDPLWRSGLDHDGMDAYLAEYGWRVIEQAGPDEFMQRYVRPTGRRLQTSQVEWSVLAEKI